MRRVLAALAVFAWAACSSSSGVPASGGAAAPSLEPPGPRDSGPMASAVEQAIGRGEIEGFVRGAPRPAAITTTPCGTRTLAPAPALVYVEGLNDPPAARVEPPAPVELRFDGCVLAPGVAIAPAASAEIALSTVDPIRHEATLALAPSPGAPAGAARRVGLALEGQRLLWSQDGPGALQVGCALHETEKATVILPPHRHHTLVDGEGRFRLSDVPAGKHKVVAWSPDGRRTEGEAVVVANATAQVTLTMP